jgi:hypothetical protein
MMNEFQRRILAEAAKFGGAATSKNEQMAKAINEAPLFATGGGGAMFGYSKQQFEAKMRQLIQKMGFEKGINKMEVSDKKMMLYFANAAKARDFIITFNGLTKRQATGSPASINTSFDKVKAPAGTNAIVTVDFSMLKTEGLDKESHLFLMLESLHEEYITEGAVKAAMEDWVEGLPKAVVAEISRKYGAKLKAAEMKGLSKTDPVRKELKQLLDKNKVAPAMGDKSRESDIAALEMMFNTFHGESVEVAEATDTHQFRVGDAVQTMVNGKPRRGVVVKVGSDALMVNVGSNPRYDIAKHKNEVKYLGTKEEVEVNEENLNIGTYGFRLDRDSGKFVLYQLSYSQGSVRFPDGRKGTVIGRYATRDEAIAAAKRNAGVKEEVENVEEGVRMMAGAEKMVKDDPIGGSSMVSSLRAAKKSLEGKPTGSVLVVTKEKSPESMSIKVYAPSDFASLTKGLTKKPEAKVGSKGSWSGGEVTVVAIKEEVEVAEQFKAGDKVKVPHKGKMVSGKIVRYDDGGTDKARQHGGGYVVDVGEPASVLVPKQKVQKEEVDIEEAKVKYLTGPGKRDSKRIIGIYTMSGKWVKDMNSEREAAAFVNKSWGESVEEDGEELTEAQQVIGKYRFTSFVEGSLKGWLISVQNKGEVGFIEEPAKKNTRTSIAPHKVFFNTKQQGNPKLVLTAFPDSTTRFVGDKEMRFAPRQLLKAVAMWMDKHGMSMVESFDISEVWWKGTDSLTKTDADGLIDDLEKAYKKGGLNGTMKVPNGDSGPVWEMIDGLTDFLRGEPKNMVAHVLKGVREFLKPEDRNNSKIKAVFESFTEAYAPLDTKGIVGAFTEATYKKRFEYRNSTDSWGKSHGLPHEVCVSYGGDRKEQWRSANVKGTVCYIAVDEGADGKPVMEKWAIRNHVKYVKAESVEIDVTEAKGVPSENDLRTWYKATGAVPPFEGAVPSYKNLKSMYTRAKTQQGKAWEIWKKLVDKGTVSEITEIDGEVIEEQDRVAVQGSKMVYVGQRLRALQSKSMMSGSVVKGENYKVATNAKGKVDLVHQAIGYRTAVRNVDATTIEALIKDRVLT